MKSALVQFVMGTIISITLGVAGSTHAEERDAATNGTNEISAYQCILEPTIDADGLNISGLAKCSYFSLSELDQTNEGADGMVKTKEVAVSLFPVGHEDMGLVTDFGDEESGERKDCDVLSVKIGAINQIGSSVKTIEFERLRNTGSEEGWIAKRYLPNTTFDQIHSYFQATPAPEKIRIYRQCGWTP